MLLLSWLELKIIDLYQSPVPLIANVSKLRYFILSVFDFQYHIMKGVNKDPISLCFKGKVLPQLKPPHEASSVRRILSKLRYFNVFFIDKSLF
jgi:hypothetical protein